MRRNLILVSLLLMALDTLAAWRFYTGYQEQMRRRSNFLNAPSPALPPPLVSIPNPPEQVSAVNYAKIAMELLFSRDRNPTVVIEAPPPKPMPALPRYYGALNFGNGLEVILATAPGAPQKRYKIGDKVGEFRLAAAGQSGLEFEWDGKKLSAAWEDMKDKTAAAAESRAPTGSSTQTSVTQTAAVVETAPSRSAETVSSVAASVASRPGVEMGSNTRGCVPGDNSPSGTVADGYRKVVSETPFGKSCRWERVN